MIKDYHYILRCINELRPVLTGQIIVEIYSQERDKLYLHIPSGEYPNRHLIISCDPQLPYLLLRNELHRAKKNTATFFSESLPAEIKDIRIASDDRIVNISTTKFDIFDLTRGSNSNVVVIDPNGNLNVFKKIKSSPDALVNEILDKEYITELVDSYVCSNDKNTYKELKNEFPFMSRRFYDELAIRLEKLKLPVQDIINNMINEIQHQSILLGFNSESKTYAFVPETFRSDVIQVNELFSSFNDAVQKYVSGYFSYKRFSELLKFLSVNIDKQIGILMNRLNNLKVRLEKGCKDDLYYKYGQLLLINLNAVRAGSKSAVLDDYLSGEEITVKLDPTKNIQENANAYFEKAKDEKKNYLISKDLYESTRIKYETYINFRDEIKSAKDLDDLFFIRDQLNIRKKQVKSKVEEQANYREYILAGKFRVLVGKDSKSNDLLTVKIAKQNDYWFHARGYSGSHVVLRVDNPKEGIPKNILKDAASIAAFYSKAKTAKVAPVAYTLRKYVRKNKNMNPGQVILTKEKVLLVSPEIPASAKETDSE